MCFLYGVFSVARVERHSNLSLNRGESATKNLLSEGNHTIFWAVMSRTKTGLFFLGIMLVVIGVVLFFIPTPTSAYTRIEVSLKNPYFDYRPNDDINTWRSFGYYSTIPSNQSFYAVGEGSAIPVNWTLYEAMNSFPLIEGATYRQSELEITVSEVHSDYFVLLVRIIS